MMKRASRIKRAELVILDGKGEASETQELNWERVP